MWVFFMREYAFPFGDFEGCFIPGEDKSYGMTLRDYFAVMAMQTVISQLISKEDLDKMDGGIEEYVGYPVSQSTRLSYYIADCMLEARKSE